MLSFTVSESLINSMISKQGEILERRRVNALSAKDLADSMVESLLVDSFVPLRWWTVYPKNLTFATLKRIGVALDPPCLCLEYTDEKGRLRHRAIQLKGHIAATGPTGPLTRRVLETHDVLVSEMQLQKSLVKLQRLIEKNASEKNAAAVSNAKTTTSLHSSAPAQKAASPKSDPIESKSSKKEAQKADLGLLYRDPEKALENVDLNEADEVTLQEFKSAMDQKFKEKVLKPGDEGYVYDRRVEIQKPTKKSDWDDSDSD
ncbi:hypothetical protein STCU_03346 [Strigomonas culicis]|nr:hypothetical protein STCU_03346 [Strigomonas culicis]|eukprot:EPY31656.1 hypothetical protein STCU_03346 [Strigomonas culicis]